MLLQQLIQDFSDDDSTSRDSLYDMLMNDVNPCLTPRYSKVKSKVHATLFSTQDAL